MIDFGDDGRVGRVHRMPSGARAVRWAALFSSPFFHPTVIVDRRVLDAHGLRYDTSFGESEDYDLWSRLLAVADGDNLREPLVLYRRHPAQASTRRADVQRDCQRRVALGQIAELVPEMGEERAELAWLVGSGRELPPGSVADAAAALGELVDAFERRHGGSEARRVRRLGARVRARRRPGDADPCGARPSTACSRCRRSRDGAGDGRRAPSGTPPPRGCATASARRPSRSRSSCRSRRPTGTRCSTASRTARRST